MRGLMRGRSNKSSRSKSFIHQGLFTSSFKSKCGREVVSAVILRFHVRPEVGPGIDRLKFGRLADDLKLKRYSIQGADHYKRTSNWGRIGSRGQENDHHQMTKTR